MLAKRIIPCLDVKDGRVVKGINFVELRDAGDPVEQASFYDAEGADELVFLDITATHEARETVRAMARSVADRVFIPFTVGGGIRTVEDMRAILRAGADKSGGRCRHYSHHRFRRRWHTGTLCRGVDRRSGRRGIGGVAFSLPAIIRGRS